jgi:hypothetical protein
MKTQIPLQLEGTASNSLLESRFLPTVQDIQQRLYSANILSAKGSLPSTFFQTLGKVFAECRKAFDKEKHSAK